MSFNITAAATGIVYRNPQPYLRSIVAYHPSLVILTESEYLATFDLGQAVESLDYHTEVARSTDGGESWQLQGPLLLDPRPGTTHSIRTSRLSDSSVVGFGLYFQRDHPTEGLINRKTSGFVPTSPFIVRSQDNGRSWSAPEMISLPLHSPAWEICHSVVELRDGRWLVPTSTWRGWNGEDELGEQTVAFLSDDQGKTWPNYSRIFDGRETGWHHMEVSVVQLLDGRILAVAWVYDMASGRTFPTEYAVSETRGETFSPSMLTGFHAQTCKLVALRDGKVFCAYRDAERPGLWGRVARLEGQQWVNISEEVLWQGGVAAVRGNLGTAENLAAVKFGYPNLKQLPSGEILVLFWCQEDCITNIRWIKVRIE